MKKVIIFLFVITMLFTLTACGEDDDNKTAEQTAEQSTEQSAKTTETTELTVWGMTCVRCENKIINALSEIDGIISVSADSKADKVTIIHDPELDINTINSIITGEGFNLP
jgi:copper chaperone CopZ